MFGKRGLRVSAPAIVLVMLLSAAQVVGGGEDRSVVADAVPEEYVKIGWMGDVYSWNPLTIATVEDYVFCYLMFSALFTYGEDWQGPVPDLATGHSTVVNPDGSMTTVIDITPNAYFRNLANPMDTSHPLTASDVAYTFNLVRSNPGSSFGYFLTDVTEIAATGEHQVTITTPYPKATLIDDIAAIPIVPQYLWSTFSNPLGSVTPSALVGSGPFMFESMVKGAWYKFKTAPNYHGEADYGSERSVKVPGIQYTLYGATVSLCIDMNNGALDAAVLTGDLNAFEHVVGGPYATVNVIKAAVAENGITDIAINAIPDAFDAGGYLTRHPALLDPFVRKAIMMTLNKDYIVNDMLCGLPVKAASVVQPGFWQADIEELPYDPAGAKQMMLDNGWVINSNGWLEASASAYGVQMGWFPAGTSLTNIRCQAPDTDPDYGHIAMAWPGWAANAGIQLIGTLESETTMVNEAWYKANYDIWVWHWGWGPEPIGGALSTWLSSEIQRGGDNCQMPMGPWWAHKDNYTDCPYINEDMIAYYDISNPSTWNGRFSAYDQNLTDAMRMMDPVERKVILDKLQQWIYDSYAENPAYYDLGLYAFTDCRFVGWGDWEAHPGRTVTSDLLWLWFDLAPRGSNLPPVFDVPLLPQYDVHVGEQVAFEVQVSDPDGDMLLVNWSFGDGATVTTVVAGDTTAPVAVWQNHTYSAPCTGLELRVTVSDGMAGHEVLSVSTVNVVDVPPSERTVGYRWHNMFNEPFGEWWDWRYEYYGNWEVVSDMYPYIYRTHDYGGVSAYYSNMRLNIMADGLTEINMNSRPQFLPYLGEERGGTAVIDWYMQYLTYEEIESYLGSSAVWYDGWMIGLEGTAHLDSIAATAVLGMTDEDLSDFDSWWAANEGMVEKAFLDWMMYEANQRLDIYPMYEYPFTPLAFDMGAYSYDGNVVLTYDMVSWGMEALMTRWLHDAFMPTEWYFEDFRLHAEIYPEVADIDVETAVVGAVFAWTDIATGIPSWAWRGMLQDYVPSSRAHPDSDFDAYNGLEYTDMYAGSPSYGEMIPFGYTPGAFNLSEGEEMWLEWPEGPQTFIIDGGLNGLMTAEYGMTSPYSEPSTYDLPANVAIDPLLRTITFEGPMDVYSWSQTQTNHHYLEAEWDRLGVLPYGMPWIEFRAYREAEPAMLIYQNVSHRVVINQTASVAITVADQYCNPCADYRGTLSFSSTDPYAWLPADYTFTAEDAGTHCFEVVFFTEGDHWLTIEDVANPSLSTSIWFDVRLPYEVDKYEPDDYYGQASVIQIDETQERSIVPEWDLDWATFTLTETTGIGISAFVNGSGDTCMALFDQYVFPYSPIAEDDNSGEGLSSLITANLPAGTYWVAVWAYNGIEEIPSYHLWLYETEVANLPPVADISWWPYEPDAGQGMSFDGSASYDPDGWITDWIWDFGDGSTGEGAWINHTYCEAGTYYVTLTVFDNSGAGASGSVSVSVRDNAEPVASLAYSPQDPVPGERVYFDARGSYDPDGRIEFYIFDFGDGAYEFSWLPEAWHTYNCEGVYTVTLTVYDSNWISNSTSVTVRVGEGASPPVAIIGHEPPMPLVGETVVFDGSQSFDPDGVIVLYTWEFGDDCVATGMVAEHVYDHHGTYQVKLTVMDGDLLVGDAIATITVASVPVASMVYSPLSPSVGDLVTFYAYGSYDEGGIVEYVWSFGDGTYALGWEAAHVYDARGTYTAVLTVTNIYGVQRSTSMTLTVDIGNSAIRGVVVSENERPIKNALVELRLSGMLVGSTKTGGTGAFMLSDLAPGVYDITISKKGYATFTTSVTVGFGVLDLGTIVLESTSGAKVLVDVENDTTWVASMLAVLLIAAFSGIAVSRWKRARTD